MADNTTNNKIVTTVELDVNKAAMEIVKLNSLASDGTADLSDRLDAKNKQIKIQNDLNKKGISDLEKQVKGLKGVVGKEKEYIKATQKLEKAKLNEVKVTERNAKTQRKLAESYDKSKGAINKLDSATGGMITRLKLLAANPIVLFLTIVTGAFMLLKEAFTSSEEGQNRYAKMLGVIDALMGNLLDVVADFSEFLVDAFSNPTESIESLGELIKENILNRFNGLMELIPQLGKAIELLFEGKFSEAAKTATNAAAKVVTGVEDIVGKFEEATESVKGFIKEQEKEANAAARVADMRAKADKIQRGLVVRRSELEAKIAENKLKARKEEEFSAKERRGFLLEAQKFEDELIDKETKALILRRDAQVLENTFSRSNKENLDAEAAAIAAVNKQQAIRATKAKKTQNELNTVTKQLATEDKKLAKEVSDFKKSIAIEEEETRLQELEKERELNLLKIETLRVSEEEKNQLKLDVESKFREDSRLLKLDEDLVDREAQNELDELEIQRKRSLGERTLELELELLERKREQDISAAGLTAKEIEVINTKSQKAQKSIGDKEQSASKAKDKAILDSGINMAADAFGIAKEVAIAKMIMAAPEALGNVWKNAADQKTIPQMLLHGIVGTATVMGPIVQGLSSIKKTRFSKSKGGDSSRGGNISAPPTPSAPPVGLSDISDVSGANASRLGANTSLSGQASADAVNGGNIASGGGNVTFSENSYSEFRSQIDFKENKTEI